MALTKTAQTPISSQSLAVGASALQSSWLPINYGAGIVVAVSCTSLPAAGTPTMYVEVAQDSSGTGAKLAYGPVSMTPTATGTTVGSFASASVNLGVGGNGGDWSHYRVTITPPTTNNVTVEVQAMTTTQL
jgi:hypothetical protein